MASQTFDEQAENQNRTCVDSLRFRKATRKKFTRKTCPGLSGRGRFPKKIVQSDKKTIDKY